MPPLRSPGRRSFSAWQPRGGAAWRARVPGTADPGDAAAPERAVEHPSRRCAQALAAVGDDQPDAALPARGQRAQEGLPGAPASDAPVATPRTSRCPPVFTPTAIIVAAGKVRPNRARNARKPAGHRLARLYVSRADPQVRPLALARPFQEGAGPPVDLPDPAADLVLGHAGPAHRLDQVIDRADRDAVDIGLLAPRGQRLPGRPVRRQEAPSLSREADQSCASAASLSPTRSCRRGSPSRAPGNRCAGLAALGRARHASPRCAPTPSASTIRPAVNLSISRTASASAPFSNGPESANLSLVVDVSSVRVQVHTSDDTQKSAMAIPITKPAVISGPPILDFGRLLRQATYPRGYVMERDTVSGVAVKARNDGGLTVRPQGLRHYQHNGRKHAYKSTAFLARVLTSAG